MSDAILNDVSDTALWVAVYRDRETHRPDALFKDPLASVLAGERGQCIEKNMSASRYVSWSVVIRTCMIDAYIVRALAEGVDTIINLGCGLDTRPYRLELPANLQWVEVDFPHIIALKETRLSDEKPRCRLTRIGLNLSNTFEREALFSKLNAESKKVLVLTEGVTPYLTKAEVGSLADALKRQPHFVFWVTDYVSPKLMKYMNSPKRKKEMKNAPFRFNPADWFAFYESHGWRKREIRYTGEESEKLGRPMPFPWPIKILRFFFRSYRNDEFKQYNGYALLEPSESLPN